MGNEAISGTPLPFIHATLIPGCTRVQRRSWVSGGGRPEAGAAPARPPTHRTRRPSREPRTSPAAARTTRPAAAHQGSTGEHTEVSGLWTYLLEYINSIVIEHQPVKADSDSTLETDL